MRETPYYDDINVGDPMPELIKDPISETQLIQYAGASGDFNPLHTVHRVGEAAGFGGVIAQGMLIMGIVGQGITNWIPNQCLHKFRVRFTGVTRPGDILTVRGHVLEKIEAEKRIVCAVEAANQEGDVKIKGSFEADLPTRP